MHISDVHDYGTTDQHAAVVESFIAKGRREQIRKEVEQLVDDEFERFQEFANEYISNIAADRAERFLERVLRGEEDAAMALLGNRSGSDRYKTVGYEEGAPWAQLIHGRLFETTGIKLRRQIVEANADLLKSERIADLEAVVDGLTRQIQQLEKRIADWET